MDCSFVQVPCRSTSDATSHNVKACMFEVAVGEVRIFKVGLQEKGTCEVRSLRARLPHIRASEDRVTQVGVADVRRPQEGAVKICVAEAGVPQVNA